MAVQRRLAAILAADVVGYSRLMGADEEGTLARLKALRAEVIEPRIAAYRGRTVKLMGDGALVEFASAVDAVRCAVDVQRAVAAAEAHTPEDRRIAFRIGINLGDVIVEGDDLYGEGVNVAARLEALAEPGGICVSAMVRDSVRNNLDAAFVDMGEQRVKNIAEPVRIYRVDLGARAAGAGLSDPPANIEALFKRPAVAVLPFANLSGDPEQEYFADGLTEDIITALSLWRSFPVIARNSTFAYKGKSVKVQEVAKALGVRYVLEGSVRKRGERIRATAQLIDADTGHHVWARKYDRDLADIFDVQDDLTRRIAAVVVPVLERAERNRLVMSRPESLDAWECVQRGMTYLYSYDKESTARARTFFQRALALDPNYGRAYVGLAFSHHRDVQFRHTDSRADSLEKCLNMARRAVELDDTDAMAHWELGIAYAMHGNNEQSAAAARLAVELNPSYALAYAVLGMALILLGRPQEGIPLLETWIERNPMDPANSVHVGNLATGYFVARHYESAIKWARLSIERRSENPQSHLVLAMSLGHLGRTDEARQTLEHLERLSPGYADPRAWWFTLSQAADRQHFLDGLRKGGWTG
jgi:adenylate cyclase